MRLFENRLHYPQYDLTKYMFFSRWQWSLCVTGVHIVPIALWPSSHSLVVNSNWHGTESILIAAGILTQSFKNNLNDRIFQAKKTKKTYFWDGYKEFFFFMGIIPSLAFHENKSKCKEKNVDRMRVLTNNISGHKHMLCNKRFSSIPRNTRERERIKNQKVFTKHHFLIETELFWIIWISFNRILIASSN